VALGASYFQRLLAANEDLCQTAQQASFFSCLHTAGGGGDGGQVRFGRQTL
jgi:hypothetical protein